MIKIILIDDLPIILEGLRLLIERVEDFDLVAEYKSGKEFIDNIDKHTVDIVLTDINMPQMDGISTTKLALEIKPNLKIIALSMFSDREFYYKMVTAGAKGFILKQSTASELETAIREVYEGGNYFSPELLRTTIVEMHGNKKETIKKNAEQLKLSDTETQLLQYLFQGSNDEEIAEKLSINIQTIEKAKSTLMQKTNTRNIAGLIIWAIKNAIVSI